MIQSQIVVKYDDHMGSDLKVVNAARASFGKESEWEENAFGQQVLSAKDARLIQFLARGYTSEEWDTLANEFLIAEKPEEIKHLIRSVRVKAQHWAPFAHPHLSVRIKAPIFVVRQLAKHQVGGVWSEVSRRYVDEEPELWFEPVLHKRPVGNIKQGASAEVAEEPYIFFHDQILTRTDLAQLNVDWYMEAVRMGVAPEEAREHLQLNMMTEWLWTGSLLFFARVCNQRLDPHAQGATREVANLIYPILQQCYPVSTEALVYKV